MKRLVVALLVAAIAVSACSKRTDGTKPTAGSLPALTVRDDTPDLLLTWVDERGDFHTTQQIADIPASARDQVRVVVTTKDDGATTDLVYVARLVDKRPDGTYAVATMTRGEWEAVAEKRRAARIAQVAPNATQSGAPSPSAPSPKAVIIYGAAWCGPCHEAQNYLKRKGIPVVYKDIEASAAAQEEMQAKLERAGRRGGSIPVIDVYGKILVGFSAPALDAAVGGGPPGMEL